MILLDKKVIEENKELVEPTNPEMGASIDIYTLYENSKEVEVLDIEEALKTYYKSSDYGLMSFHTWIIHQHYQLIKIKE